jgi:hypothetical protein
MAVNARRLVAALLASLFLVGGITSADDSQPITAILVEVHSMAKCVGLDCPPWPVPDDNDFCFQLGDNFYTGIDRPSPVPWARKGERLLALKGKAVEIIVTDKTIKVRAPRIHLRLKRVHKDAAFQLESCAHN